MTSLLLSICIKERKRLLESYTRYIACVYHSASLRKCSLSAALAFEFFSTWKKFFILRFGKNLSFLKSFGVKTFHESLVSRASTCRSGVFGWSSSIGLWILVSCRNRKVLTFLEILSPLATELQWSDRIKMRSLWAIWKFQIVIMQKIDWRNKLKIDWIQAIDSINLIVNWKMEIWISTTSSL